MLRLLPVLLAACLVLFPGPRATAEAEAYPAIDSTHQQIDRSFGTGGLISVPATGGYATDIAVSGTELLCYTGWSGSDLVRCTDTGRHWQGALTVRHVDTDDVWALRLVDTRRACVARKGTSDTMLEYWGVTGPPVPAARLPFCCPRSFATSGTGFLAAAGGDDSVDVALGSPGAQPASRSVSALRIPMAGSDTPELQAAAIGPESAYLAGLRPSGQDGQETVLFALGADPKTAVPRLDWTAVADGFCESLVVDIAPTPTSAVPNAPSRRDLLAAQAPIRRCSDTDTDASPTLPTFASPAGVTMVGSERGGENSFSGYLLAARFGPDGHPDTAFGNSGRVVVDLSALWKTKTDTDDAPSRIRDGGHAAAYDGRGRLVIAAASMRGGESRFVLVRLTRDGHPDDTFGTGGVLEVRFGEGQFRAWASCLSMAPDGAITCGGFVHQSDAPEKFVVIRLIEP